MANIQNFGFMTGAFDYVERVEFFARRWRRLKQIFADLIFLICVYRGGAWRSWGATAHSSDYYCR